MKKITFLLFFVVQLLCYSQEQDLFTADFSPLDLSEFDQVVNSASSENFEVIVVGSHDSAAQVAFDPALVPQDERLITPSLDLTDATSAEVEFNWFASYFWSVDPNENYDLNILVSTDGGATYTEIWDETMGQQFTSTADNFLWLEERTPPQPLEIVDLSAYLGESDVKIAFQYLGVDGAQGAFDDITVRANITLSTQQQAFQGFTHSVKGGFLTLSSNINMNSVELFNVIGQNVLKKKLTANREEISLASLQQGVYLVRVSIENSSKTFKIVKN